MDDMQTLSEVGWHLRGGEYSGQLHFHARPYREERN